MPGGDKKVYYSAVVSNPIPDPDCSSYRGFVDADGHFIFCIGYSTDYNMAAIFSAIDEDYITDYFPDAPSDAFDFGELDIEAFVSTTIVHQIDDKYIKRPVPTGGTSGQVLSKKTNADGDFE